MEPLTIVSPRCWSRKGRTDIEYPKELLKGNTESLLLALVADTPMYGYQLVKELESRSRGYFHFKEGTLYPALHRLEKDGLIEGRWMASSLGKKRRYYSLTDKGHLALESKVSQWAGFSRAVSMVLAPAS